MGDQLAVLVRRFRRRAQLTQEALAERSGVSIRTIRSIETARQRNPQLASVRQLADALDVSASEREEIVAAVMDAPGPTVSDTRSVPRQLPSAPQGFTGRTAELRDLTAFLDLRAGSGAAVCAISGAGGMGKTWLALHWAHQHLDRFPDGQLFVNLRGFDPSADPMPPETALRGFLSTLGVAAAAMPTDLDALTGLYRSLLADKRILIVADNAADTAQIVPLLPGSPSCTMLVTSRSWLPGLVTAHGAHPVTMDVLSDTEANMLLIERLGAARLADEPEATADLIAYCAGLPLALGIIAGRARIRPRLPLAALSTELRDAALHALAGDDPATSLPIVLASSYRALAQDRARVLGLVSIAPGPDISLPAAASLTGLPVAAAHLALRGLEQLSLVQEGANGRWRIHDLIRQHAAYQAGRTLPDADRDAALRRLVDFYLHTAYHGDHLLDPFRTTIELAPPVPGCVPHALHDDTAAIAWFDAEHACLLAVQQEAAARGWDEAVWQLGWTLNRFHYRQARFHDDVTVLRIAVTGADRVGDPVTRIATHRLLGLAVARAGDHDEGLRHLRQALTLAEQVGDGLLQATTHHAIAGVCGWAGQDRVALNHARTALALYREHGATQVAEALNLVGWFGARAGDHDVARTHCEAALALHRRNHDDGNVAITLDSLGFIDHRTGRHADALDHYGQAIDLLRERDDVNQLANTLEALGDPYLALGQTAQALEVWQEALTLYETQLRTEDAARLRQRLTGLDVVSRAVRSRVC